MPTISYSDNLIGSSATTNNVMGRLIAYGQSAQALLGNGYYTGAQWVGYIYIMKGVFPTNISSLTTFGSRSSDALCGWFSSNFSPSSSTYYLNPCTISSVFTTATASGTATWFWWHARTTVDGGNLDTGSIAIALAGTVGATGSGADLEISSTTITAGQQLRLINLRMQSPVTFNY